MALILIKGVPRSSFSLASYPEVAHVSGGDFAHASELDVILSGLKKGRREVFGKPDYVLVMYSDLSEPDYLSLYLSEGFVFEGHFLDAWTERMIGRKSTVYLLSFEEAEKARELLSRP